MKNLSKLLFLIIVASAIVVACQKENSPDVETQDVFDSNAAKEWYYGTFKKSPEWATYNSIANGKKLPDWRNGVIKKLGNMELVEFPLVKEKNRITISANNTLNENDKRKISDASADHIVFIKHKTGSIIVKEIQYIPDMDYLSNHNYDISNNTIGNIDLDFSGTIVTRKWSGEPSSMIFLKNGKVIKAVKPSYFIQNRGLVMRPQACLVGQTQVTEWERIDETHLYGDGLFTIEYGVWHQTGSYYCIDNEEINNNPDCATPNSPECFCQLNPELCGEPGGGDPPPPPQPLTCDNQTQDPCIHNSVDYAISLDCKNEITNFINATFVNSNEFHLIFFDGPIVGVHSGDDAYTMCGPMSTDLNQVKTTIKLNTSQLGDASKEFIAATILHEAVHAWIDYKFPVQPENAQQHSMMADQGRFIMMKSALYEMYPNTPDQDLIDLTWGGLSNTIQYNLLPYTDKLRIQQTYEDYKHKSSPTGKGTPC